MIAELNDSHSSLDVPQHARHVTGTSDDLPVIDKTAATEVTRVSAELASPLRVIPVLVVEVLDRADVVQPAASNEIARR